MKRKTIRKHFDFICPQDSISMRGDIFTIRTKTAKFSDDSRYGLVVPKKIFKLAVQRNRAKRLLRDWISFCEDLMLNNFDYIFIANKNILETNREMGRSEMKRLLEKIARKFHEAAK